MFAQICRSRFELDRVLKMLPHENNKTTSEFNKIPCIGDALQLSWHDQPCRDRRDQLNWIMTDWNWTGSLAQSTRKGACVCARPKYWWVWFNTRKEFHWSPPDQINQSPNLHGFGSFRGDDVKLRWAVQACVTSIFSGGTSSASPYYICRVDAIRVPPGESLIEKSVQMLH